MKGLKVKVITGFKAGQSFTVGAEEAHKAYWLFLHPDERGVFDCGVAVVGRVIQGIEPDYNATMGWNPSHLLGVDDWAEIRRLGTEKRLQDVMALAKNAARMMDRDRINMPLSEAVKMLE